MTLPVTLTTNAIDCFRRRQKYLCFASRHFVGVIIMSTQCACLLLCDITFYKYSVSFVPVLAWPLSRGLEKFILLAFEGSDSPG